MDADTNGVKRLEPFGKQRQEFGEAEGPRGPGELARAGCELTNKTRGSFLAKAQLQ